MQLVDLTKCEEETGFTELQLLSLTGIFGVHSRMDFAKLYGDRKIQYLIFYDEDVLKVEVKGSPDVKELRIFIRDEEIYIDLFEREPTSVTQNVGFKRLISQIEAAKGKFKKITLWAYGSYEECSEWDGYIIWGKYGFSMSNAQEETDFLKLIKNDRLDKECKSISDLVFDNRGTAYWKHAGNSWEAEFLLDEKSENMKVYKEYGTKRKLL